MKLLVRPNSTKGKLMLALNDGTLIPYQTYSEIEITERIVSDISCKIRFLIDTRLVHPVKYNRKTKELSYNGKVLDVDNLAISGSADIEVQHATVTCTIKDIIIDLDAE